MKLKEKALLSLVSPPVNIILGVHLSHNYFTHKLPIVMEKDGFLSREGGGSHMFIKLRLSKVLPHQSLFHKGGAASLRHLK